MQSQSLLKRSWNIRKEKIHYGWDKAKRMKICYLFLAPYAVLFTTFFILPIVTSIYFGMMISISRMMTLSTLPP